MSTDESLENFNKRKAQKRITPLTSFFHDEETGEIINIEKEIFTDIKIEEEEGEIPVATYIDETGWLLLFSLILRKFGIIH